MQVLGRRDERKTDREGRSQDSSAAPAPDAFSPETLEVALNQLESGILMVSSLTRDDGCAQRLACKLGDIAKENVSK